MLKMFTILIGLKNICLNHIDFSTEIVISTKTKKNKVSLQWEAATMLRVGVGVGVGGCVCVHIFF